MDGPRDEGGSDDAGAYPSVSPSSARRELGRQLRALRKSAGLRLGEVSTATGFSSPTISRIEAGSRISRFVEVDGLLRLYSQKISNGVRPGVREWIVELAATSRTRQWYEPFRDVITGRLTSPDIQQYVDYERDSSELRDFQSEIVPGLLQTRAYILAMARIFFPDATAGQHERFVEFRLARQQILVEPGRRLSFAINEMAVLRPVVEGLDRAEQFRALQEVVEGRRSNVTLDIVPHDATVPAALGGPFVHFTLPNGTDTEDDGGVVYLESRSGGDYLRSRTESERFLGHFESLREIAMSPEQASAFLADVQEGLS